MLKSFRMVPVLGLVLGLLGFTQTAATSMAQGASDWPSKPVRLIVTFPPGGASDIVARLLAQKLADSLGQQVIVDNRAGAGGSIGADAAARSAPDGYTVVLSNLAPFTLSPLLYASVNYDPLKSFTHIAFVGASPIALVVGANEPWKTIGEFVAAAKAAPGKISYGSTGGTGSAGHIAGEMLNTAAKINVVHVPFRGAPQMVSEIKAGTLSGGYGPITELLGPIKDGTLRALVLTAPARVSAAPSVPTAVESGMADVIGENWLGLSAPAGIPAAATAKLNAAVNAALDAPDIKAKFEELAVGTRKMTPDEFRDYIVAANNRWQPVLKATGAKAE